LLLLLFNNLWVTRESIFDLLRDVLWGARITRDAYMRKGTREPIDRRALYYCRLNIKSDPGIKISPSKDRRVLLVSYNLVANSYHGGLCESL
jgi:hypothetical protein